MKPGIIALLLLASFTALPISVAAQAVKNDVDSRLFELRVYYTHPGRLEALNTRFRDHTTKLFEKHGMQNIGYWIPTDEAQGANNKLIYVLAHSSRQAREESWKAFGNDPDWKAVHKASTADGEIVQKVESILMKVTDYSPKVQPETESPQCIFELRVYKATPNNLDNLNARFRNHTVDLFSKHGMEHIGYWTPVDKSKGSEDTLIYILAHDSKEARDASFSAFRQDPAWTKARKASEEKAGGSLTVSVDSTLMKPTDYSPTK